MRERAKVFTYISGTGATVIETSLEDHLNQWLSSIDGEIREISQSESTRDGNGHHVTVCIWYIPAGRGLPAS